MPAKVAEQLRLLIARGTLAPGVHLGQADLAQRFDVSRVPVREALKRLAAEGIVMHDPNRGFFIAPISSDEARQLYRLRHILEAAILATLEWPDNLQVRQLARQVDAIEELRDAGRFTEWSAAHRTFHRHIFELSPEKFMVEEALRFWSKSDRYRSLMIASSEHARGESSDRHLLQALKIRDRERLLEVFHADRNHLEVKLLAALRARGL